VDPEQRARREQERVIRERERLKFRVYAAVREAVLATELFRTHFELHEPDITVNVYARFVDVNASLNEGQLRLLPAAGRARELNRFAAELRSGLERVAGALHLEFATDVARYGGSEPVILVDVPCGYRAVLVRPPTE
jgi:hypothetical protein